MGKKSWQVPARCMEIVILAVLAIAIAAYYLLFKDHLTKHAQGTGNVVDIFKLRTSASMLDPDLLQDAPSDYEKSFKNPCWRGKDNELRCLPYFYISGFHTGAGALGRRLASHPNVMMDAGRLSSWGHAWGFWSEYRNKIGDYLGGIKPSIPMLQKEPSANVIMDGAMSTFALYWASSGKAHRAFSSVAVACWAECDKEFKGSAGPGYEACMENKCLPAGREADLKAAEKAGLDYADAQLPMLMRALYGPRTPKFVFMLRPPVQRIYSAFFGLPSFQQRYGNKTEHFTQFVAEQVMAYRECVRKHSEQLCIMRFETLGIAEEKTFFHCDQLLRGMYAVYLKTWFKFFPRDSFLIINSLDYFENSRDVTIKVLKFLELPVPDHDSPVWAAMESAGPRVSNTDKQGHIPEGARRVLSKLYKEHNKELANLLHDDSYMKWNVD